MITPARGTRAGMTDDNQEFPKLPMPTQTRHGAYWCNDWDRCHQCLAIAHWYYPHMFRDLRRPAPTPEQRVAKFFGGSGDSYSSYRAMHDHWFLVIIATLFDPANWGSRRRR